jgi:putative peptide zinc metalloprotease protein
MTPIGPGPELQGAISSSLWYRIAATRPKLQPHVRLVRQHAGDAVWYVLDNPLASRHLRLDLPTYRIVAQLRGDHTVGELWEAWWANAASNVQAPPTQEQMIELLGQLYEADALTGEGSPDIEDLQRRHRERVNKDRKSRYTNPMALRFRLFDPQPLIDALLRGLRALGVSRLPWWALWCALMGTAIGLLPYHWGALSQNVSDRLLSLDNLLVLLVLFPLVKIAHELAHGMACRLRGGEVHELGVMFLVFYPVPYVDASSSNAFASRWDRFITGAAGMALELAIAALAFFVWIILEPGLARGIAFDVMVLAGLTTLLFNANPLMRYDGYYMLSDALNIPNLGQQSTQYWRWLLESKVQRDPRAQAPRDAARAPIALLLYGPIATVYRLSVLLTIAWFIAQHYFVVGVLFAGWTLATGLAWPGIKFVRYLMRRHLNAAPGTRGVWWVAVAAGLALLILVAVPVPYRSVAVGVVVPPESALIRAAAPGWVERIEVDSNTEVRASSAVLQLDQPLLKAQLGAQEARVALAQAKLRASWLTEPAKGEQLQQDLRAEQAALSYLQGRIGNTQVLAAAHGTLWWQQEADLLGRYVKQGEVMGFVGASPSDPEPSPAIVRFVLQPDVAALFESQPARPSVSMRPTWSTHSMPMTLVRSTPQLTRTLPSTALGKPAGGPIAVDPSDSNGTNAVEAWALMDAQPASDHARLVDLQRHLGARVWVRIDHPWEPWAWRHARALRRAFLSQFHT